MNWIPVYAPGNHPVLFYLDVPTLVAVDLGKRGIVHERGVTELPYTNAALLNRRERGADVPSVWTPQVFAITVDAGERTEAA